MLNNLLRNREWYGGVGHVRSHSGSATAWPLWDKQCQSLAGQRSHCFFEDSEAVAHNRWAASGYERLAAAYHRLRQPVVRSEKASQ